MRAPTDTPLSSAVGAEPLGGIRSHLGESPIWDHRIRRLLWVDILGGLIHATNPETGVTVTTAVGRHVSAVALYGETSYLLAVREGFALLADGAISGSVEVNADPGVRMNDGKVDPGGRFLAGSMAYDLSEGRGRLYVREVDGSVRVLLDAVTISNGIAWSLAATEMYYVDSATGGVDVFDYEIAGGTISNRRRLVTVSGDDGVPDGITVDSEGCVWVALYNGGRVRRYSPEGKLIDQIEVPAAQVTSCAFGGSDLTQLFITTAREGFNASDQDAQPLAGRLFVATPGCGGRPEPVVPALDPARVST